MGIKAGDIVYVRHYSGANPIRGIVHEIQGDILTIKLTKDFATFNFFEGDPVAVGFESGGEIYITGCTMVSVNLKQSTTSLKLGAMEQITGKRKNERFPVSIYAAVREKGSVSNHTAVVKNISIDGIMFCSKVDFSLDRNLEIELYPDGKAIFLNSKIIWRVNNQHSFEYGVEIIYKGRRITEQFRNLTQQLKKEQQSLINLFLGQ